MRLSLLIVIASFGVSLLSAYVFISEYRVARLSVVSRLAGFETLLSAPPRRPGSLYADKNIFLACHRALTGTLARVQPKDALETVSTYCRNAALAALDSSPTSAHAHYTLALAASVLGDDGTANRELLASQQNAPFESWLAKRRFKLALALGSRLGADGNTAFERDIRSLLQSPKGRKFIARRFVTWPKLQDRIIASADTLSESIQAALLNEIRRAMNAGAGRT